MCKNPLISIIIPAYNRSQIIADWNKVTVNTMFLKENVLELGFPENKVSVVPMAIDLNFYSPKKHPKTLVNNEYQLVSIGRLIPFKGHEFGIRTVKKLIEKGYKVNYTIVGYGKLYEALKTLIQELKLENIVFLYGVATQKEIKDILENAHLFLMTSVADATGRQETQGVVSAEAQAMGLPIAGFNSGGVPFTVIKNTSILVEQKDTEALAQAVINILKDKEHYKSMSLEAKKWANKQFGLTKMFTDYYHDIV